MSSICTGCGNSDKPAGVLAQRAAQELHVEPVDVQGDVGQGVIGNQVEGDVGVAQGEVEIDQGDVVVRVSWASVQPRLTARLVQPTPPLEPTMDMTSDSARVAPFMGAAGVAPRRDWPAAVAGRAAALRERPERSEIPWPRPARLAGSIGRRRGS